MMEARLVSLALVALCVGCAAPGGTIGREGVVELSYIDAWHACERDCSLEVPVAVGADVLVWVVNQEDVPLLSARSADPDILGVYATSSAEVFRLHGVAEGTARLELVDSRDRPVDTFEVRVAPIARVGRRGSGGLPALTSETVSIELEVFDRSGQRLRGFGGVRYEATPNVTVRPYNLGERIASISGGLAGGRSGIDAEWIDVAGDLSGGEGVVSAFPTVGAPLELRFEVVAPIVESLRLSWHPVETGVTVIATIDVANEGPGVFACCEWELGPPGVSAYFSQRECARARVGTTDASVAQPATVTCRVRDLEASVDVEIPLPSM